MGTLSKAKAAKLVRQLVDLFLDMESAVGLEVDLCKVSNFSVYNNSNLEPRNALNGHDKKSETICVKVGVPSV